MKIEEGRTKLTVQHQGKDLTFIYPPFGHNDYSNVQEQIEKAKLKAPTMAQTTALAHSIFNSDDIYSKGIKNIAEYFWLWGFTGNLYVPNKGVYIEDNPERRGGNLFVKRKKILFMDESELEERLEAKDPSVRFVPFGFKVGLMSSLELAKNPYIIGLVGEEGAEKLAEIADKHKGQPKLWSFKSVSESTIRVSELYFAMGLEERLDVSGYDPGDCREGYALGIQANK